MTITYATQNSLVNGLRRMSKQFSYTTPPAGQRRTLPAATLNTITFSAYNSANYSTTRSKFGAGSLDLEVSNKSIYYNSYSSTSTGGGWPTGTGDFCIEGWVWVPTAHTNAATGDPITFNLTGGLCVRFGTGYNSGNFNALSIWARGQADLDIGSITWPREQWVHWAVQRRSAVISLWANGNKLTRSNGGGGTAASRSFAAGSGTVVIGTYNNNGGTDETVKAWLDEICVSNTWRYDDASSTYTVPTAAFTVDTGTNLLIHFDSNLTTAAT